MMNCHDNKNNGKDSGIKHLLHMILCCAIPIVIIFVLPLISGINPRVAGLLSIITPFICPVMMGGMILIMLRKNK
jgi:archaellum biogenesis protein FlaJ (TadC family)